MITLNLLSREKKEELRFRKIYLMGKDFACIIFIFTVLIAIILSVANIILVNTFNDTISNSYIFGSKNRIFEDDLNKLNSKLENMRKVQSDFVAYDELMLDVNDYVPENIILTYLSINTDSKKAVFKGYALKREDLLNLKNNLENSNLFEKVESPLANLLEKDNINFNITADLKL
ncbi:MAG: PilN domain-containing protein [bacterium]